MDSFMITAIIVAAVIVGGTGIIIGIVLGVAGEKFKVEVDPREEAIGEALPGNNCGACGYPGCSGLAAAIAKGEAPVNQCPVGGAAVAEVIGGIMGVSVDASEKNVAFVMCGGDCEKTRNLYDYTGVQDCSVVKLMPGGGPKACNYGCMGFGTCVSVCEFDAIHIVNGVAVVDKEKCVACEKCIKACPQNIIELVPYKMTHAVNCHSNDKGKGLMDACDIGCIGCRKCEKVCPKGAITIDNFLAHIDQSKCVGCGICAAACPRDIIIGRKAKVVPKPKPAAKPAPAAAAAAAGAAKAAEKAEGVKAETAAKAEEVKADAAAKAEEVKADAAAKTEEVKAEAVEKVEEVKAEAAEKAEEVKAEAVEKAEEVKAEAAEKVEEVKAEAAEIVEEVKTEA